MTTKICANPACAREFQATTKRVEFCCRQCYLDVAPPSPGAFTPKAAVKAAGRRWTKFRTKRAGACDGVDLCPCPDCVAARGTDRTALIARVAAEMGVSVSPPAPPKRKRGMTRQQFEAHHASIRAGRKRAEQVWT